MEIKCNTCIGKYEYKTCLPCRYCMWNRESYFGRVEEKMTHDGYIYVKNDKGTNIPY